MKRSGPVPALAVGAGTAEVLRLAGLDTEALSPEEQKRADCFRDPSDRADYVAAHLLVRLVAARFSGLDPRDIELVQRCADCGGPHGKPSVRGMPRLTVSLSHSRGVVAAAAGDQPVGVDVEALDSPPLPPEALPLVLSPAELSALPADTTAARSAFLRTWVRKESLVKCGVLRLGTMRDTDLSAVCDDGRYAGRWHFRDWRHNGTPGGVAGYVAAAVSTGTPRRSTLSQLLHPVVEVAR